MRDHRGGLLLVSVALSACAPVFTAADFGEPTGSREEARMMAEAYDRTARRIAALPESFRVRERAARYGIDIVDPLGEVAARSRPGAPDPREPTAGLEIRLPGFVAPSLNAESGRSAGGVLAPTFRSPSAPLLEVRADRFFLRVGNHHGETLRTVPLSQLLSDLGRYVTSPASLTGPASVGERLSLSAPRDSHLFVEVQTAVVPIPVRGRVAIRPVVWSSASAPRAPAILAVVASREGTSVRVIENRPEDRSLVGSGQLVDFNDGGDRRAFGLARRPMEAITVIEIPLVSGQIAVRAETGQRAKDGPARGEAPAAPQAAASPSASPGARSGPFVEGSGDRVERDESRPLRATVFLLYPVADGELSDADWESISARLRSVSVSPEVVGALALPESDARAPQALEVSAPQGARLK